MIIVPNFASTYRKMFLIINYIFMEWCLENVLSFNELSKLCSINAKHTRDRLRDSAELSKLR